MNKSSDILGKLEYYSNLFDFYENLFTEKQKQYFKDYYFYDLSLSEIATNYNVSRSAVFDAIDKIHKNLDEYEENLGLYKKNKIRNDLCDEYESKAKNSKNLLVLDLIEKIREIE